MKKIALSLAFLTALGSPLFAIAQTPNRPANIRVNMQNDTPTTGDFIVGPARVFLQIPPGEERTVELEITNRTGFLSAFNFETEDFDADAERQGTPVFFSSDLEGSYPARTWITPEISRMELLHGERAFVRVTIKVPRDADAGDHQAGLIVVRETQTEQTGGFHIISRVASLFIITVPGDIVQEGYVDSLSAHKYLNWFFPVTLNLSARNMGTVYMAPTGTIAIRNIFGITVDEIPVKNWVILRNSSRIRDFEWRPVFALGYYRAETNLTAYDGRPLDPVSTSFWVVPLMPLLLLLLAIFGVSFLVQYFSARYEITRKPAPRTTTKKRR